MRVYSDPVCLSHNPQHEILSGKPVPYLESPTRISKIKDVLRRRGTFEIMDHADPDINALRFILSVHGRDYVQYLETAYDRWVEDGGDKAAVIPETFPHPKLLTTAPANQSISTIIAQAGIYCFDLSAPITKDTYKAAVASARVTLSAARYLTTLGNPTKSSCPAVFALSRPPGHHAGSTISGGYCFFNNVAIAARCFQSLDKSRCPIAILDIDYHHGNGTQEMFYSDESVLYVSLHAENDFPYFTGSRAEEGAGAGVGFNVNMPLPQETGDEQYLDALSKATDRIKKFRPTFVIVSLGVDTHEHDPICKFNITTPCYRRIGESIRSIARPTLFVLEGGYHLDSIGDNVANVLQGFEVAKVS